MNSEDKKEIIESIETLGNDIERLCSRIENVYFFDARMEDIEKRLTDIEYQLRIRK